MIEKQEPDNWLDAHVKESTPNPANFGYVPLPTNVEGEPQGSVYMAHLRQENTIGSMLNRKTSYQLSGETQEDYDFTNYVNRIPKNHLAYADRYFGATTDDEFNQITQQLDGELKDKSLLAANPWKSLAYAFDPLEPTNWLPGGAIYKEAKAGAAIAKSMLGVGVSAMASTGVQEAVLHQNQLTRTMQESIFNVVGAGLFGGVIGGGISAFGSRRLSKALGAEEIKSHQRIQDDINNAISPNETLSAAKSNIMDGNEIARMPKYIAKTMVLTPMNRLLNSPFKTAKWFGSSAYEHGYELGKNGGGIATPTSLEMSIKMEMQNLGNLQIEHMNYYYEMHGVTSKYFKATRKKMQELGTESPLNINLDQFNRAVYETALTGVDHELPQINKAAKMWRNEFDRLKDIAVNEGLLPEGVTVPNAANYIMVAYNKNKIIEEGGKAARGDGTFAQHIFDQFQESNESVKQFLESPMYTEAQDKIKGLKNKTQGKDFVTLYRGEGKNAPSGIWWTKNLKQAQAYAKSSEGKIFAFDIHKDELSKHFEEKDSGTFNEHYSFLGNKSELESVVNSKRYIYDGKNPKKAREITPEEKERITAEIEKIEQDILDNAPQSAKTWEGKLHNVIEGDGIQSTEELIWDQVGQTIDHILGDSDGKLLNPYLSKLGGATKPFKARKLIIDQLQASPWHITDIQRLADMHNRAMVPAIKMQQFAKANGFKDIDDFLLGMGDSIRKEFDKAAEGKTGKAAQKLRAQYDEAIKDMQATVQMLQGVYGQGFNVLNNKGAEFFNNIMNWNYTRMLGHMTLAALPDLGRLLMKNPLMDTLAQGIGDSFSTVKKMNKNDIQAMGYAIATEQASLFKTYVEHHGLSTNPSPFTKGLTSLARNFGNLSLMNPWQDIIQNMAGHVAINKILRIVHKSVDGKKVSQKETTLLARLGIGKEHYADIAKFTDGNIMGGTRFSDWTNWDIKTGSESAASRAFQTAVGRSIEEITVNPRLGDKPLLLQQKGAFGNFTNLLFQFKSYMFAATNRILYSGIQNRNDINMYLGIVAMMGMGMLGYVASSITRGSKEQLDLSPTNLLSEGLDRSGVLGILGEVINIGRKQLQLGEVSRYKSRDAFGSLLGPTGGSVSELVSLFNKINPLSSAKGEWTTKDAAIIMKLMPVQNVFYLQSLNRQLFHKVAEGLGATPVND